MRGRPGLLALPWLPRWRWQPAGKAPEQAAAPRPVVSMPARADGQPRIWLLLPGQIEERATPPSCPFRVGGKIVRAPRAAGRHGAARPQALARLDPADARKNAASAHARLTAAVHDLDYAQRQLARDRDQRPREADPGKH